LIGSNCPTCKRPIAGHRIAGFASVIIYSVPSPGVDRLDQLIDAKQWEDAAAFQEGRHDSDVVEYYVLICPDEKVSLLRFLQTFELWDSDFLDSSFLVSPEDGAKLIGLAKGEWMELWLGPVGWSVSPEGKVLCPDCGAKKMLQHV